MIQLLWFARPLVMCSNATVFGERYNKEFCAAVGEQRD